MSNIYIQEPPTTGKVLMKTSVGDIDLELWTKETPKACRNFIQLCMEGYYNETIFHRLVKGFIVQGGDPTGTGEGGESIYGNPFKDEFHTRLRFCRRGLLAMANAGKDDNGSQFFFTFTATPELQNKHTIFGKVAGETIYNMLKLEDALVDDNERPIYPQKIIKTEVLLNPFQDIAPRTSSNFGNEEKEKKKEKKSGIKNFKLLSFGEQAEEDEEESVVLNKQFSGKGKSAHDNLSDPKLSRAPAIEPGGPPSKKKKEDRSSDWESGGEDHHDNDKTEEQILEAKKQAVEMKKRIMDKLSEKKLSDKKKKEIEYDETSDKSDLEEYYLGKDRDDERKKKAEAIREEIKEFKRGIYREKKAKEENEKKQKDKNEKKSKRNNVIMDEYTPNQDKYKEAKARVPKKGKERDDFALELLNKFKNKLHSQNREGSSHSENLRADTNNEDMDNDDVNDDSWMMHSLNCEDNKPVIAKDASTKDDDWFEIYDPRNPLNKRRRGETMKSKTHRKNYKSNR